MQGSMEELVMDLLRIDIVLGFSVSYINRQHEHLHAVSLNKGIHTLRDGQEWDQGHSVML